MIEMNKKVKGLWIEALRSGEYQQCSNRLNNGKGFCCLGVLTDLYIKTTGLGKWIDDGSPESPTAKTFEGDYSSEHYELPLEVIHWAELETVYTNPVVHYRIEDEDGEAVWEEDGLANLNDEKKFSFIAIADIIERYM